MNNQVSYSPNFGMALYAPTQKKITKVLGKEVATEFEKVRPALEKIANGVDIYVKPDKAWFEIDNPAADGFMLYAGNFKSKLNAKLKLFKYLFLEPYRPNSGYRWVNLKDMSSVGDRLVAGAEKIITEV